MKKIFRLTCIAGCVLATAGLSWSADSKPAGKKGTAETQKQELPAGLSGKVVDSMDSGGYTYVQLDQGGKKIWVATTPIKVKKGQQITFRPGMEMQNFESKSLKRTFDRIVFSEGPVDHKTSAAGEVKSGGGKGSSAAPSEKISVEKAAGSNAYTINEIYNSRKSLNGKSATIRAKVVKVTAGIMNMNWIHLQDGSGDSSKATHNLVATSSELPAAGDIVTASGIIAVDKDFGSGYKYVVLLEKATFKK